MSIYSEIILDHYQRPRNFGRINNPTLISKRSNPLCGDEILLTVILDKNKIKEIKFAGKGCAVSIAASSMVTEYLKGKDRHHLKKINKDFIIKLLGIKLGINRIKCALLVLDAINNLD